MSELTFKYTSNYPKLISDMLEHLYINKCLDEDIIEVIRLGYYIDPKLCTLAWEICADAWCDIWNNDTNIVVAIRNAIIDWDL